MAFLQMMAQTVAIIGHLILFFYVIEPVTYS